MERLITVKGMGKIAVKPDLIVVSMGLSLRAVSYEDTAALAESALSKLIAAVESAGFKRDSIKTADFNINTVYENERDPSGAYKNVFKGFACSHELRLEFDFDTSRLAQLISAVGKSGSDPRLGISFTVGDKGAATDELLKNAAADARKKAEVLAVSLQVRIGKLISIDYSKNENDYISATRFERPRAFATNAMSDNIQIIPEDIKATETVTFVWEII